MALAPRDVVINYGGVAFGEGTARQIDGKIQVEESWTRYAVEFTILIVQATAAAFATEVRAVEDAFRKPNQTLTITLNGQTQWNFAFGGNTIANADPSIRKLPDDVADTGLTRRYRVRIEGDLTTSNQSGAEIFDTTHPGIRSAVYNVQYSPARRRTVTISGEWTAISGSNAVDAYNAKIDALATLVLDNLGGNYELAEEPLFELPKDSANPSSQAKPKLLRFSRVYEEILFAQAGASVSSGTQGARGDPDISRQDLRIAKRQDAPGDSTPAERFAFADISYQAWISKTVTDLKGKYESGIRPWLVTEAARLLTGSVAVLSLRPEFDYDQNRITVTGVVAGKAGPKAIERRLSVEDSEEPGDLLVAVWSGNPRAKYRFQGPARRRRAFVETVRLLGGELNGDPFADELFRPRPGAVILSKRTTFTPLRLGLPGERQFEVTDATRSMEIEMYDDPPRVRVQEGPTTVGPPIQFDQPAAAGLRPSEDLRDLERLLR